MAVFLVPSSKCAENIAIAGRDTGNSEISLLSNEKVFLGKGMMLGLITHGITIHPFSSEGKSFV